MTSYKHPLCARCYKHLIGVNGQWRDLFPLGAYKDGKKRLCCFCEKPTQGAYVAGKVDQCGLAHA